MARSIVLLIAIFSQPLLVEQPLFAKQDIHFDVPNTVIAEDVSTSDFHQSHPGEKLIRIALPISTLVHAPEEDVLAQTLFLISGSTTSPFQIVDYQPTTALATDVDGLITTERSRDQSKSVGMNVVASAELAANGNAEARASAGSRKSERLTRLPEKQLLSASGTMHRGVSVYFKLKPSTQTTLEGSKLFTFTARVRQDWRAGLLFVNCAAFGKSDNSQQGFVVGVSMTGDAEAKRSVEALALSQWQLKDLAQRHSNKIEERRFPSVGHRIGGALSVVKPKIPTHWLNKLLTSGDYHRFEKHLPRDVQQAATSYREARTQVIAMAG